MKPKTINIILCLVIVFFLTSCHSLNSQEDILRDGYTSLLCVRKDGKFGFINEMGIEVIPCKFDQPSSFKEGWAALKKGKKWAYYNAQGQIVLDLGTRFTHCGEFHDGVAFVSTAPTKDMLSVYASYWDNLCQDFQFIDKNGKILFDIKNPWEVDCSYINGLGFSDGFLKVMHETSDGKVIGFLNKEGQLEIPFESRNLRSIRGSFSEGLLVAGKKGIDPHTEEPRNFYGYMDPSGEWKIPPIYIKALPFKHGVAIVWEENPKRQYSYHTYMIDQKGDRVFPREIETNERLVRDSLLAVFKPVLNEDGVEVFGAFGQYRRYALARIDGTLITDFIYADLQPGKTVNDLWMSSLPDKKAYGGLDDFGNVVLPYQFPSIYFPFEYGLAVVQLPDNSNGRTVINTKGDIVLPAESGANYEISEGVVSMYDGENFTYFNRFGQVINLQDYEPAGIFKYLN